LLVSELTGFVANSDENRWYRKPKPSGRKIQPPSTWRGPSKQILLKQVRCEARKTLAVAVVFFLDFAL